MTSVFEGFKPENLWRHFAQILRIPHCSGDEQALGDYIISLAEKSGLESKRDAAGNVLVKKPATPGHEGAPGVILQGHIDMVCEKNSDVTHDFSTDSIQAEKKGEWIQARGTTLGSDNGIGVAAALAVLEDDSLVHGPLECLFTVDEETGLTGATKISPDFLQGRILLNLDSEEEGVFTIGCAGGADSEIILPLEREGQLEGAVFRLKLSGFRGGHSGLDINQGRGNAIKLLARMLFQASRTHSFQLVGIHGGNKRNAIPREAWADLAVPDAKSEETAGAFQELFNSIRQEYRTVESEARMSWEPVTGEDRRPLTPSSQQALVNLLFAMPHGVLSMHPEMKDLVETSTNLAIVQTQEDAAQAVCSSRSSVASSLEAIRDTITAFCEIAGARVNQPEGYPGWTPNLKSPLLRTCINVYKRRFQKTPEVGAVHAGLECGIIGEKFPGMDMISFGPTIEHPHSPEERVHFGSVETFWEFLKDVLEELA